MTRRCRPLAERFAAKHRPSETHAYEGTPCWEWTGCRHYQGYGQIRDTKANGFRVLKAHRVSYEMHHGPIPEDRPVVNHRCERKWCCNPAHLEAVTQSENTYYSTPAERERRVADLEKWYAEHSEDF